MSVAKSSSTGGTMQPVLKHFNRLRKGLFTG
jgi:hypothetical protein